MPRMSMQRSPSPNPQYAKLLKTTEFPAPSPTTTKRVFDVVIFLSG